MAENKQRIPTRLASPTSSDVARKAGVSQAAVSYVFNGRANRHVSEQTRDKILRAAQELGYHAHPSARSLRKGQSDEICCIINAPPSFFSYRLYFSLQQQIVAHEYTPVFYTSPDTPTPRWRETLQGMFARRPVGLVMSQLVDTADVITLARHMGIEHIVLISIRPVEHVATIIFPGHSVGHIVAQHLLERGHRHLGIVHPGDPLLEEIFQQRLEGMRSALTGRTAARLDILPLTPTLPGARSLIQTSLNRADHPTGIYAFNDEFAFYLLKALSERDISVPKEIAIVGTDDLFTCELMRPSLTSICFDDVDVIGKRAIDMLIGMHSGQSLSQLLSYEIIPQLIQRESS
jgi:DNA-binding LacI/PurR family transcriptional regulator